VPRHGVHVDGAGRREVKFTRRTFRWRDGRGRRPSQRAIPAGRLLRRPSRITWSEAAISPRRNGGAEISAEEHQEKKRKTDCGGWRARLRCRRFEIENAERAEEHHSGSGDVFPTANRQVICAGVLSADCSDRVDLLFGQVTVAVNLDAAPRRPICDVEALLKISQWAVPVGQRVHGGLPGGPLHHLNLPALGFRSSAMRVSGSGYL